MLLRRVIFRPYRGPASADRPVFTLSVFDSARASSGPQTPLAYRLTQTGKRQPIFDGDDFGCSPCHAIDSDDMVRSLMGFLTLRPGDTDADYFAAYTPEQIAFCDHHAEALAMEVYARFGED